MSRRLATTLALALLLSAGVSTRWVKAWREGSPQLAAGVDALERLPATIGDWQAETITIDPLILRVADCDGYRSRRYTNLSNGWVVDVTILVGRPGPISAHTPEVCFPGLGYTVARGSKQLVPVSDVVGATPGASTEPLSSGEPAGQLARMTFLHPRLGPLSVWHAWFDGSQWSRPSYPRFQFADREVLFRLMVTAATLSGGDDETSDDPAEAFLRDALPAITTALALDATS